MKAEIQAPIGIALDNIDDQSFPLQIGDTATGCVLIWPKVKKNFVPKDVKIKQRGKTISAEAATVTSALLDSGQVAIKSIRLSAKHGSEEVDRLNYLLCWLSNFEHPNIVRFFGRDVNLLQNACYGIVMELLPGRAK